ncbi:hypothetical protein [Psittacicella gerlachiana]|uniref:Uncharacterized protein n=1 Tax=Psittacicella gerlachiana TaxID=2028574 RepID=A0A3A1YEA0_9GAMM|nr:hypothetical protein [Psittacicella gerlachiana]RIY35871.1 hypothetical protein CKF59_03160 [Psittacicella gerlachiana]
MPSLNHISYRPNADQQRSQLEKIKNQALKIIQQEIKLNTQIVKQLNAYEQILIPLLELSCRLLELKYSSVDAKQSIVQAFFANHKIHFQDQTKVLALLNLLLAYSRDHLFLFQAQDPQLGYCRNKDFLASCWQENIKQVQHRLKETMQLEAVHQLEAESLLAEVGILRQSKAQSQEFTQKCLELFVNLKGSPLESAKLKQRVINYTHILLSQSHLSFLTNLGAWNDKQQKSKTPSTKKSKEPQEVREILVAWSPERKFIYFIGCILLNFSAEQNYLYQQLQQESKEQFLAFILEEHFKRYEASLEQQQQELASCREVLLEEKARLDKALKSLKQADIFTYLLSKSVPKKPVAPFKEKYSGKKQDNFFLQAEYLQQQQHIGGQGKTRKHFFWHQLSCFDYLQCFVALFTRRLERRVEQGLAYSYLFKLTLSQLIIKSKPLVAKLQFSMYKRFRKCFLYLRIITVKLRKNSYLKAIYGFIHWIKSKYKEHMEYYFKKALGFICWRRKKVADKAKLGKAEIKGQVEAS